MDETVLNGRDVRDIAGNYVRTFAPVTHPNGITVGATVTQPTPVPEDYFTRRQKAALVIPWPKPEDHPRV